MHGIAFDEPFVDLRLRPLVPARVDQRVNSCDAKLGSTLDTRQYLRHVNMHVEHLVNTQRTRRVSIRYPTSLITCDDLPYTMQIFLLVRMQCRKRASMRDNQHEAQREIMRDMT